MTGPGTIPDCPLSGILFTAWNIVGLAAKRGSGSCRRRALEPRGMYASAYIDAAGGEILTRDVLRHAAAGASKCLVVRCYAIPRRAWYTFGAGDGLFRRGRRQAAVFTAFTSLKSFGFELNTVLIGLPSRCPPALAGSLALRLLERVPWKRAMRVRRLPGPAKLGNDKDSLTSVHSDVLSW
jgi:hypothetical protein